MSWCDEGGVARGPTPVTLTATPPTVAQVARKWPLIAVIVVSVLGIGAAGLNSPRASTVAYAALLVAGCGLLFYRRFDAIAASRTAGGAGLLTVQPVEKAAVAVLALSCLANGFVIALEIASWPIWSGQLAIHNSESTSGLSPESDG